MFARLLISIFFLCTFFLSYAGNRLAVITENTTGAAFLSLHQFLSEKKYDIEVIDLRDYKSFPADLVFEFLSGAAIRLVDSRAGDLGFSLQEAEVWSEFLASRGSLVVFADKFGADEVYNAELLSYVGFALNRRHVKTQLIEGIKKDLITDGINLKVEIDREMDTIRPFEGSMTEVVFTDKEKTEILGIKQQSCTFRISWFPFLPDEILLKSQKDKLLEAILDWNLGLALAPGMQAPDFPAFTMNHEAIGFYNHLENENTKPVLVLEFMASWCSYCAKQLPNMVKLHQEYKDLDVTFQFVSYKETIDTVKKYLKEHPEITWSVLGTENGIGGKRYGVKSLPYTFIIDPERKIFSIFKGNASYEDLKSEIEKARQSYRFKKLY